MKLVSLFLCMTAALAEPTITKRSDLLGIDVVSYQSNVNWSTLKLIGTSSAHIKATDGTHTTYFSSQYTGATNAGLIRGGYHFSHPESSTGATQASYFLKHGGDWSADGITILGRLTSSPGDVSLSNRSLRYGRDNPSDAERYSLSASSMVSWIKVSPKSSTL